MRIDFKPKSRICSQESKIVVSTTNRKTTEPAAMRGPPVAPVVLLGALTPTSSYGFEISRLAIPFPPKQTAGGDFHQPSALRSSKIGDDPSLSQFASAALVSMLVFSSSSPALGFDANVYNHDYADPFHPLCKRNIKVSADGSAFHYSGTAVGPKDDTVLRGCSKQEIQEYKLRKGAFDGFILQDGKISAGDGIDEGVWEPAGSASTSLGYEDKDGIRWNDGNKWVVIEESNVWEQGFKQFTLLYILVSLVAGAKELVKRANEAALR